MDSVDVVAGDDEWFGADIDPDANRGDLIGYGLGGWRHRGSFRVP